MRKLVSRGYITEGVILEMTYFFYVPKGAEDIHMVFDEIISGLNNYLWDPKFMVSSMGSLLVIMGLETHMVYLDSGEVFYNFRLY